MRYSEQRLRRLLALVRIGLGAVYITYGYTKLFDTAYYEYIFVPRLSTWENLVAPWYGWAWQMIWAHTHRWELFFGTVEMFIGVALLLGLATRPACLVGLVYLFHRLSLTWYPDDQVFELYRFIELHIEQIGFGCVFLLLGFGHAGDVWGLGALYRGVRLRLHSSQPRTAGYSYFVEEQPAESETNVAAPESTEMNPESRQSA